jgi:hypothetical protein
MSTTRPSGLRSARHGRKHRPPDSEVRRTGPHSAQNRTAKRSPDLGQKTRSSTLAADGQGMGSIGTPGTSGTAGPAPPRSGPDGPRYGPRRRWPAPPVAVGELRRLGPRQLTPEVWPSRRLSPCGQDLRPVAAISAARSSSLPQSRGPPSPH